MIVHAGNVFWFDSADKKPDTNRLVLVNGGVAKWDGMLWITETGDASGRPIRWDVRYWAELPKPPVIGE